MEKSVVDTALIERCRRSLDYAREGKQICPPFRAALAACAEGDVARASREIQALEDRPLYVAIQHLGFQYLEAGRPASELEPLHDLIRQRIKKDSVNWISDIGRAWTERWIKQVGRHLAVPDLSAFGSPYVGHCLRRACEVWCHEGEPDKALIYAEAISAYDKEDRARSLALVGATQPEGKQRRDALANALKVDVKSIIETGYEETAAFAGIVTVLAERGFPADDEVVTQACAMLARLNKRRVERDARSAAVLLAVSASAKRAGATRDPGWLNLASSLLPHLWDDQIRFRGAIVVALAQRSMGFENAAAKTFASVSPDFLGGPELAARLSAPFSGANEAFEPFLEERNQEIWLPWVVHAAGGELDKAFNAALRRVDSSMGRVRIYAQMLALDCPSREDVAGELSAEDRTGACLQAIELTRRINADERYRRLLADLDLTAYKGYADSSLLLLDEANLRKLEDLVTGGGNPHVARNRIPVLTTLAVAHLDAGRPEASRECIEAALLPPTADEQPGWRAPSDRPHEPEEELTLEPGTSLDRPFAEALRAAEQTPDDGNSQRLKALHELARHVVGDGEALGKILVKMKKAPTMRDQNMQGVKKCRLGHVHLLMGDVDAALDIAAGVTQCRMSGWGGWRLTMLISDWFSRHRDTFTPAHAKRMLEVLEAHHPQDLPMPIIHVGSQVIRDLPVSSRSSAVQQLLGLRGRFRQTGDQSVVHAALGVAYAELKMGDDARAEFRKAVELVEQGNDFYRPQLALTRALLRAGKSTDIPQRGEWTQRILKSVKDQPYQIVWCWESAMLELFAAGDQSTLPALLAGGDVASDVAEGIKRSWRAEAARVAPRPVEAVLALFDDTPKNQDLAKEQILNVAKALEKADRSEEAASVRALLA